MAPRETENNAHAKFWGDKERALWYVMVFSGVVNYTPTSRLILILNFCMWISHTRFIPSNLFCPE